MECFVWSESLATGAVHEDGSAMVIAKDLQAALQLLREYDKARAASDRRHATNYAKPASETTPTVIFYVAGEELARVVVTEVGCDC